jgi:hypothetical protein
VGNRGGEALAVAEMIAGGTMTNPLVATGRVPGKAGWALTAETAAALLGTSTAILSLWEDRFGYPVPEASADGQRLYPDEMMIALRDAVGRELSIPSAITEARRQEAQ